MPSLLLRIFYLKFNLKNLEFRIIYSVTVCSLKNKKMTTYQLVDKPKMKLKDAYSKCNFFLLHSSLLSEFQILFAHESILFY